MSVVSILGSEYSNDPIFTGESFLKVLQFDVFSAHFSVSNGIKPVRLVVLSSHLVKSIET